MQSALPSKLTPDKVASYAAHGFLLPQRQVFPADRFNELRSIFEEHLAEKGDKLSDELDTPHFRDPRLLGFLLADEVLDLVEPLIGPDIALWSSHFLSKDPFTGMPTPWHEDSAYWQGRLSAYDGIVTMWLALDRSNRENGCLRVIPGTHRDGFSDYESTSRDRLFTKQIRGEVDEESAVDFELEPGQCSLHDGRIIHGARANTSPHRRTGYAMRYISAAIRVIPEANPGHRIWLARGRNLAGNAYETS
jgi:chlorinating enzyme